MTRRLCKLSPLAVLVIAAACTQAPADIELKGQSTYGRNASNGYASNNAGGSAYGGESSYQPAPVYTNTPPVQSAPLSSIGVSDVAPPSKSSWQPQSSMPSNAPFKLASPAAPAPVPQQQQQQPQVAMAAPVNAWDQKPRFSDASMPLEEPVKPDHPVAALDDVVGNSGDVKPAAAKPVAKVAEAGFVWPVGSKKIISGFGPKGGGKTNDGINIAAKSGDPVYAAAGGEIVYVGNTLPGYGNMVLIKHHGGTTTAYAHLSRILVDKYGRVRQGDVIGYVGTTGGVKEPQLHFAIRDANKQPLDPAKYLN